MLRTRAGYAGGTTKNPTYYSIGDHTESLQIDYDPSKITFAEVADLFWKSHNPCEMKGNRQYMSILFYANEEQKQIAFATRDREAARRGAAITTAILPLTEFTRAEDYHQKHELRHNAELMRDFRRMYPNARDFVDSTAAARINGYLAGNGSKNQMEKEIELFGLTESGKQALRTGMSY